MSELEKLDTLDTGEGPSKWMIIAGIVIVVILVIILSLIYSKIAPKKNAVGSKPTQKTINFLDEPIPGGSSTDIEMRTIGGASTQGLFLGPQSEEKYRRVIAGSNLKPWNRETSQFAGDRDGSRADGLSADGYENSYNVANSENYRRVIANANVKLGNRETSQSWGPRADSRSEGLTAEELARLASGGATDGDDISKGITVNEIVFENTVFEDDPISKTAIRNARKAAVASQMSANVLASKRKEEADAAEAAKAKTFGAFVAAKGGLMEVDEAIPYIIIDGKNVAAPGIGGLGYYANYQSNMLTGGSISNQGPQTGTYNTKSYYGYNPYSSDTEATLPYGNSVFGYRGIPVGSGAVVVDVTGEAPSEFEDSGVAGQGSNFEKGDLVGIYEGTGYYTDTSLYADGINVVDPINTIALSGVIAEEAEIEYQQELQKVIDEENLASSTDCDPMLIYKRFIGLVDDGADNTTPLSAR